MNRLRVGQVLEIHPNPWSRPGPPIVTEGAPTEEEIARWTAETAARRSAWHPDAKAEQLLTTLRNLVGCWVEFLPWSVFLVWDELEGYFPIRADLVGVETPLGPDGHPEPKLVVRDPSAVPNKYGSDGTGLLQPTGDGVTFLFDVAQLVWIKRIRAQPRRPR